MECKDTDIKLFEEHVATVQENIDTNHSDGQEAADTATALMIFIIDNPAAQRSGVYRAQLAISNLVLKGG